MTAHKLHPVYLNDNPPAVVKDIQENYATGYIKVYRSVRNHWIWEDPRKFQWWMDILMECNHDDKKVPIGFELFDCKRGQTLHSRLEWSKRWRVDESTVRRFLTMLEADNMISTENLKKTTRITVCKYGSYNDVRPAKDQPRNPDASQTQYEQECKELKEEYDALEKNKKSLNQFIKDKKPPFIDPYVLYWNLFAEEKGLSKVKSITKARKAKLNTRLKEPAFNFLQIIFHAAKSDFIMSGGKWFTFDWILENETNYVKVLEGNYESKGPKQPATQQPTNNPLSILKKL
jgi:DNA replication protein DnaD